ncbi:MAG: heparinase II/III family protein, partial [Clostridia bacterium]|nr:heparinase II/III family protein [Clostridia bacterium]
DETEEQNIFDFIDLFAAETGQAMAEILYFVGDKLPARLVRRMRFELDRRIFKPFERRSFWWEKSPTNWAAVCAGSVGMVYLYEKPHSFETVKERIYSSLDSFLSGFSEEGVCFEGLSYWNYGFGYYIYFAALLYDATDGREDILHRDLVEKIARFQQKMFIGGSVVSFSDCTRHTIYQPGLTCYLAKTFDGVAIPPNGVPEWMDNCARFSSCVRNLVWLDKNAPISEETGWDYMQTAGWYISRKKDFSFAAKAVHNQEPHNQNDVGSFIIADENGQVLMDYGSGEYTNQYFMRKTRYLDLCNSSRGHSVPEIDGIAQYDGREFSAANVAATENEFSMDMAKAYPVDGLEKLERSFRVEDNKVTVRDKYVFTDTKEHKICERFVSMNKPVLTDDGVRLGGFLLKSDHTPKIAQGTVKHHTTYQPETLYFVEYHGDFREFTLEIISMEK